MLVLGGLSLCPGCRIPDPLQVWLETIPLCSVTSQVGVNQMVDKWVDVAIASFLKKKKRYFGFSVKYTYLLAFPVEIT